MNIGDREVLQTQIGEHVIYQKAKYDEIWYDCPDVTQLSENQGYTLNGGSSAIKYHDESHSITVKSDLLVLSELGPKDSVCLFQLPDGFIWGDGSMDKIVIDSWTRVFTDGGYSTYRSNITYDTTYEAGKMFVSPAINAASTVAGCGLTPKKWLGQGSDIKSNVVILFNSSVELPGVYKVQN